MTARQWAAALADLVLPVQCLGCAANGIAWCAGCVASALELAVHQPDPPPARFPQTVRAAAYDADVREAVVGFKEHSRRDLLPPLARLLVAAVRSVAQPDAVLLPAPSSRSARRQRGSEHMIDLGQAVARRCGLQLVKGLAKRPGADAVGMSAAARRKDRQSSIVARAGLAQTLAGRRVILIDDVVTTGATLARCAALARAAGASDVRAAVVCATVRQIPRG